MLKVYVAGKYSGDNALSVLQNIGRGRKACAELFEGGFAPFCPWHDASYVTDNPDADFNVDDFYRYSMDWLNVSDAMLVLPGWEDSKGTCEEIDFALDQGIPTFYRVSDLIEHRAHLGGDTDKNEKIKALRFKPHAYEEFERHSTCDWCGARTDDPFNVGDDMVCKACKECCDIAWFLAR